MSWKFYHLASRLQTDWLMSLLMRLDLGWNSDFSPQFQWESRGFCWDCLGECFPNWIERSAQKTIKRRFNLYFGHTWCLCISPVNNNDLFLHPPQTNERISNRHNSLGFAGREFSADIFGLLELATTSVSTTFEPVITRFVDRYDTWNATSD